ncbi:hypothetical protein P3472_23675, partial [Vibrio parahaemolyticus]|nr:hypothetical protein [Vibrio parahaemolyticus]
MVKVLCGHFCIARLRPLTWRYTTFKLGAVDVIDTYQTLIAGVVG